MNILTTMTLALSFTFANTLQAACPGLIGDYICQGGLVGDHVCRGKSEHPTYQVFITQRDISGITTYGIYYKTVHNGVHGPEKSIIVIANGIDQNEGDWLVNNSCGADNTLRVHATHEKYDIQATYSRTNRGELRIETRCQNLEAASHINIHVTTCSPALFEPSPVGS